MDGLVGGVYRSGYIFDDSDKTSYLIILMSGVNGDAVSVERLVMQTMFSAAEDGVVFEVLNRGEAVHTVNYRNFCGGWVGWHCEGSVLRTLFALLMWEELFEIRIDDVFQTRFQDSPLDLYADGGLFYINRKDAIDAKVETLHKATHAELIGEYVTVFGIVIISCLLLSCT